MVRSKCDANVDTTDLLLAQEGRTRTQAEARAGGARNSERRWPRMLEFRLNRGAEFVPPKEGKAVALPVAGGRNTANSGQGFFLDIGKESLKDIRAEESKG